MGSGWHVWLHRRPRPDQRVLLAREPDGVTRHEPVPDGPPVRMCDIPPWFNVAGLLWREPDA